MLTVRPTSCHGRWDCGDTSPEVLAVLFCCQDAYGITSPLASQPAMKQQLKLVLLRAVNGAWLLSKVAHEWAPVEQERFADTEQSYAQSGMHISLACHVALCYTDTDHNNELMWLVHYSCGHTFHLACMHSLGHVDVNCFLTLWLQHDSTQRQVQEGCLSYPKLLLPMPRVNSKFLD